MPESEMGSTRLHSVEKLRWKKLWTCKADNKMNEMHSKSRT